MRDLQLLDVSSQHSHLTVSIPGFSARSGRFIMVNRASDGTDSS
jgi:hypothetical protein